MTMTVQNPKVSEALLIWFFETFMKREEDACAGKPMHVPDAEARRLPAVFQLVSGETHFQIFSNLRTPADIESRLLSTLHTPAVGHGFVQAGDAPTYAWEYHVHGKDRVLLMGGNMLSVRGESQPKIMEPLLLWCFEQFMKRINDACVRMPDEEPNEALVRQLPAMLEVSAGGSEFRVLSTMRVSVDTERQRLVAVLRQPPATMGRWYGDTQREKVWARYVLGPYSVLIICRKMMSVSTALYRNGG